METAMKKVKKYVFILLGVTILVTLIVTFIRYQRGWFTEMIPDTGSAESWGKRNIGEVIEEEFLTGEKRWHDGNWTFLDSTYEVAPEGVTLQNTLDVTVTRGNFKFVVYNLGKGTTQEEAYQIRFLGPDMYEKVYEQDITESGVYHLDFSDFEPDAVHWLSIMTTMDGDNEYSYTWVMTSSAPRWYRLHDKWLTKLPFVDEIWETYPW